MNVTIEIGKKLAEHLAYIDAFQQAAYFERIGDLESADSWRDMGKRIEAALDKNAFESIPPDEREMIDRVFRGENVCFGEPCNIEASIMLEAA
jgi:hypothetical protein